jgi:hypothetical protein
MCQTGIQCRRCRTGVVNVALGGLSVAAGAGAVLFLLHYAVIAILGGTSTTLAVTGSQKVLLRHTVMRAVPGAPRTLPSRGAPPGAATPGRATGAQTDSHTRTRPRGTPAVEAVRPITRRTNEGTGMRRRRSTRSAA